MSEFEKAKKIFEIESSGGIEENISVSEDLGDSNASLSTPREPSKPTPKTIVSKIREEEKVKAAAPVLPSSDKLELFKRLIKGTGRARFLTLCKEKDPRDTQYVIFEDFNTVLKNMGFRLRPEEARQIVRLLNVFNERRNVVFYYKVVNAVLRKLYVRETYKPPAPLNQEKAIMVIIAGLKRIKAARLARKQLLTKPKVPPNPREIMKSLAGRLATGPNLLETFHKIDKDGSGFIELAELTLLFADYGVKLLPVEVKATFDLIDTGRRGKITYNDIWRLVDSEAKTSPEEAKQTDVLSQVTISGKERDTINRECLTTLQTAVNSRPEPLATVLQRFDPSNTRKLQFPQFVDLVRFYGLDNTEFDLRQVFNFIDNNKNGFVDFKELMDVLMVAEKKPEAAGLLLKQMKAQEPATEVPFEQRMAEVRMTQELKAKKDEENAKKDSAIADMQSSKVPPIPIIQEPSKLAEEIEKMNKEKEQQEKKQIEKSITDKYKSDLEEIKEVPKSEQIFEKPLLPVPTKSTLHKSKPSSEKEQTARTSLYSMERTSKKSEPKAKLTLEEKAVKAVPPPQKSQAMVNEQRKQLEALFKTEIVKPAIRQAVIYAESLSMNKSIQKEYQSRPAVKELFLRSEEWERPVVNVLPRSLWTVGQIGRVGLIDQKAALIQFDLSTGQSFQPIHVGRRAPLREVPILAVACDPKSFRLYLLDKQWILEVWELHQHSSGPMLKFPVLSKPIGQDYVELEYTERNRDLYPTILTVADSQMLLVNATAADGCVYFFSPVSLTIVTKLRINLSEFETPKSVQVALERFAKVLQQCEAIGISQKKAFQLMDKNGDGELSKEELEAAVKDLHVDIKEEDLKGMVRAMDLDGSGRISLQEFSESFSIQSRLEKLQSAKEQASYVIPDWVNSLNANATAREALYKLFQAFDQKGYDPVHLFAIFDADNSGVISKVEFERTLLQMLAPIITQSEIDILSLLADRDNSGYINYQEFTQLLNSRHLTPVQTDLLDSGSISRDSITYVQHRCLELGIDLLKLLQSEGAVITKPKLGRLLLSLPLGLSHEDVSAICERDVHFDPEGCFDYEELFRNEVYIKLVQAAEKRFAPASKTAVAKKLIHFSLLPEGEKHAVVEDVAYIEDLQLLAFTIVKPKSSIVFLKHMNGKLLARLVGHMNRAPPILLYVRSAACLVTAEKRAVRSGTKSREKLCEILLWNLHGDLVERFQTNPPWTMRPVIRVQAHEENVMDLAYLPISQLVVSSGADHTIKLWNPTGRPYSLTERHRLSFAKQKPGYYNKAPKQSTQSNQPMALVDTIRLGDSTGFRLSVATYGTAEWLLALNLNPPKLGAEGKYSPGFVRVFGFDKVKLEIPVNKFDVPVPTEVIEKCQKLNKRKRVLDHFRGGLPGAIDLIQSQVKVQNTLIRELKEVLRLGVLMESEKHLGEAFQALGQLPFRKQFSSSREISPGEVYRLLTRVGLLVKTSYSQFLQSLEECKRLHRTQALGISLSYTHPGFATLALHIRNQTLDLDAWLSKQDPKKTGVIDRKSLQKQIIALGYGLTEAETNGMMEELDPYLTCKIQTLRLSELFASDVLAGKLLGLSKPTELINKLRSAIFPHHAKQLQYALFEVGDATGNLSLSEFTRALNQSQIAAESDISRAVFDLFADHGRLSIPFFIRQVYSQKHSSALKDIDQVLLEIKLRLMYQRLPLEVFFTDENGPLTVIGVDEFVDKGKKLGVEVIEAALIKTAKFLSTTFAKGEGIQLAHFLKHMQRLPESMTFQPKAGPPVEVVKKILEGKIKKDATELKQVLVKNADSSGQLTPAQMRSALNSYFHLEIASPVIDSILTDLIGVQSLHFSQVLSKLNDAVARPSSNSVKVENVNLVLRELIMQHANQAHRPFEDLCKQIFQALKDRDKSSKGWLPVADFVNVLRFTLPELSKELQGQIFLSADKEQINIETFALEALRGVPGILTASQAEKAKKKLETTVDEAFFQITSAVRSSGVSLDRAFALFDKDKDRVISVNEFQQALGILDLHLQREHMEALLEVFDRNHDGVISYQEFLQAINTHTSAKPTVDLDHWRVHFLKLPPSLCQKLLPKLEMFTVKVMKTNPQEYLIPYKVFRDVLEELSGFDMQEIEALGDFAVEGSKEQLTTDLLPSQMTRATYAVSKLNQLIHYSHFTEAFQHLMKPEKPIEPQVSEPVRPDPLPVSKPVVVLTPGERLEKELFEYLSKRLTDQHISLEKLFIAIDTDGDGVVSKEELGLFMRALGYRLQPSDLDALMKTVDENADQTLSFKELRVKLLKYGYVEPGEKDVYTHQWADQALVKWVQLFNLQRESGFSDYHVLFERYDYNKDRVLSSPELRTAILEVAGGKMTKEEIEHVAQILLIRSLGELSFDALNTALRLVERDLPRQKSQDNSLDLSLFVQMVNQNSPFSAVRKTADRLGEAALSLRRKQQLKQVSRGLSLYSHQLFLLVTKDLLRQTKTRLEELLRVVSARCHNSILNEAGQILINPQDLGQANFLDFPESRKTLVPRLQNGDFRVVWDASTAYNYAIKMCGGVLLKTQTQVTVEVYSPEGLKHISGDGNTSEKHLSTMLQFHTYLQEKRPELLQCIGAYERRVGVDATEKEVFVFLEQRPGRTMLEAVSTNGGLLHIPVIQNTRSSLFLIKFWGRLVLDLMFELQSHSVVLRTLRPENLLLSPDGLTISLVSLKGMGFFDQSGVVSEAPDIGEFLPQTGNPMDDPYLAPEYLLARSSELTSAVDVWSFGALLYELLIGHPPPSFFTAIRAWYGTRPMPEDLFTVKPVPQPSLSFVYAPFSEIEVRKGKVVPATHKTLNLINCIQVRSYSGLVRDTDAVKESKVNFESALAQLTVTEDNQELQEVYDRLATLQHTSSEKKNELGLLFDLIGLCLRVDGSRRPTLKALVKSPFFQMDQYEIIQAKRLAGSMSAFKSPDLTVTQRITKPLQSLITKLEGKVSLVGMFIELADQVEHCVCETAEAKAATQELNALLTLHESEPESTSAQVSGTQKDALLQEALNSSNAALIKQIVQDKVLDMLVYIALTLFKHGEEAPLVRLTQLLSSVMFEFYTFASPASPYADNFLNVLLKLFSGESLQLASSLSQDSVPITAYMLRSSFWTPRLYQIVGPLYKDTISENGLGQHYYPVIRDYIANETRSADYFSELISLAENLFLLRIETTGTAAKKNALKHVRSMLITRNSEKLKAALDLRLPQHLIHLLQDPDHQVRLETIQIFQELSRGCVEPEALHVSKALETHKFFSVLNFFGVAKEYTKESTKDLVKYALPKSEDSPALLEIAKCMESPAYLVPLVRLLKMKSEPYVNKEALVLCLLNILRGTDGMIRACTSPATDGLSTLCKSLVVHARNTDNRSSKMLTPIIKDALERVLAQGRPVLLRAFENTPGAKALLRDQELTIPKPVTLQLLQGTCPTPPFSFETATVDTVFALMRDTKCWLEYIYIQSGVQHDVAHTCIGQVVHTLISLTDFLWEIVTKVPGPGMFVEFSDSQRLKAKAVMKGTIELLHWTVTKRFEYLWLDDKQNLTWLCESLHRSLSECLFGDVFHVYPLTDECVLFQSILVLLLTREPALKPLADQNFGGLLAAQLTMQYDFVQKVMTNSTEFLQVIPFYARQCDLRLQALESLLSTSHHQLQVQFLETRFVESLAAQRLTYHKSLDARFSKLNHPFLPFRECAPVRGEAIAMVQIILHKKQDSPEVYDDLILQLRRANTVQAELGNLKLYKHGSVVHATALQLLTVLVESGDSQLDFLLIQEEAHQAIAQVIEKHPILAHRYPVLKKYCDQFN